MRFKNMYVHGLCETEYSFHLGQRVPFYLGLRVHFELQYTVYKNYYKNLRKK